MEENHVSDQAQRFTETFTSRRHMWRLTSNLPARATLLDELIARLPHIDSTSWAHRFSLGGVYVNRIRMTENVALATPCVVEYFEPLFDISRISEALPPLSPDAVIWSDEDLCIVHKPAGLPSTAPRDIAEWNVQAMLSRRLGRPVHIATRLDVAVSGLMLCGLSARMNRYLQKAQLRGRIEKMYLAQVHGKVEWDTHRAEFPIGRNSRHTVLRSVNLEDGIPALTEFARLAQFETDRGERYSLVRARPLTGRTHQIRVHAAALSHPIVGDPYYGGERVIDDTKHLCLCSFAVRTLHPYRNEKMVVTIPPHLYPRWLREDNILEVLNQEFLPTLRCQETP